MPCFFCTYTYLYKILSLNLKKNKIMKKNKIIAIVLLFMLNLFLFSSCYTKRNGIVPCPQGYNDIQIEKVGDIQIEPA